MVQYGHIKGAEASGNGEALANGAEELVLLEAGSCPDGAGKLVDEFGQFLLQFIKLGVINFRKLALSNIFL